MVFKDFGLQLYELGSLTIEQTSRFEASRACIYEQALIVLYVESKNRNGVLNSKIGLEIKGPKTYGTSSKGIHFFPSAPAIKGC